MDIEVQATTIHLLLRCWGGFPHSVDAQKREKERAKKSPRATANYVFSGPKAVAQAQGSRARNVSLIKLISKTCQPNESKRSTRMLQMKHNECKCNPIPCIGWNDTSLRRHVRAVGQFMPRRLGGRLWMWNCVRASTAARKCHWAFHVESRRNLRCF